MMVVVPLNWFYPELAVQLCGNWFVYIEARCFCCSQTILCIDLYFFLPISLNRNHQMSQSHNQSSVFIRVSFVPVSLVLAY